jgi:hypothetical protein
MTKRSPEDRHARVCAATITLAQLAAKKAVKRQLQAEGRVKVNHLSAAELSRLAHVYLLEHSVELVPRIGRIKRPNFEGFFRSKNNILQIRDWLAGAGGFEPPHGRNQNPLVAQFTAS